MKYLFWIYKLILLGLSVLVLTRDNIFRQPGVGLDPSWNIGINLAVSNNFTFGKDIVFTYGPLGYLHTRLPIGVTKNQYLLWDAFLLVIFIAILFYVYKRLNSVLTALMAFAAILIFSRGAVTVETLFLPFLFLIFYHLRHDSLISLILASLFSLILFYAKVNVGLAAVVLMLVYLIYQYLFPAKRGRRFVLAYTAVFLGTVVLSALFLKTYLPGYIWGGLQLANAYNDAMYLSVNSNPYGVPATYLALGSIIPLVIILVVNFKYLAKNNNALLRALFVSAYVFILFKYSFVRADWHMLNYFQSISLAIGLLAFFSTRPLSSQLAGAMGLSILLSMPYATGIYDLKEFAETASTFPIQKFASGTATHVTRKYDGFREYLSQAIDPVYGSLPPHMPDDSKIPDKFLQIIGQQSVDIVPWEVSYIYANNLTYDPRPVFQSYQAYNDYLDSQNRDKYVSDNAPEYILFEVDKIDNQHPSFIESKTRLAMVTHYQYVDHLDDLILLQRRKEPLDNVEFSPLTANSQLDQDIPIEQTDDLLMMSFDIDYSLAGKLARTFFQPPALYVTVKFQDGNEKTYRAIKSVINGQVMVNKFIGRTKDAVSFFSEPEKFDNQVIAISFHSPEAWGFKPEFTYSIKRIRFQPGVTQSN